MSAYPDWFTPYAWPMFAKHLTPLAGKPGLRFLQIGAFTGDASVWMLDNILTGPRAHLIDVDTWQGSDEPGHAGLDWTDVEATYDERVRGRYVLKHRMTSAEFFRQNSRDFDFIYIDGDHTPTGVLEDAVAAIPLLRSDGLLAFDDYLWTDHRTGRGPGIAVDAVEACYKGRLRLIQVGAQAWFRKVDQ